MDSTFFEMFSFHLMQGDAQHVVTEPGSIAISHSMARKYFGRGNPMGQSMLLNNTTALTVTGVFRDVPDTSHMQFDYVISFSTLGDNDQSSWWSNPYYTFVQLHPDATVQSVNDAGAQLVETYIAEQAARSGIEVEILLQPLLDIRSFPKGNDLSDGRGIRHLYVLSGIAIFILLLACINFINLATDSPMN